jgi:surface antigen
MSLIRRAGCAVVAGLLVAAITVGLAPSASAGTYTAFPISGVVKCKDGTAVSGVWVESTRGGSNFASLTRFPDGSAAKFYLLLQIYSPETSRGSNVNLKVGCGYKPGTTNQWLTTNVTTRPVTVHSQSNSASPDPIWLNVNCTPNNLQCTWPNAPSGMYSRPRTQPNPFPGGWCTTGAAERWRDLLDVWPSWNGDGGAWGANARNFGYTVESDIPRLGSFVSIPKGSPAPPYSNDPSGHIVQVRDIAISGSTVSMTVYEMHGGSDPLGVARWASKRQWAPGMLAITPPYSPEGDTNADGLLTMLDFSYFSSKYGTNDPRADFNDDGIANLLDYSLFSTWY